MPALLINNKFYGDTPSDKQQEIINVINQASKSWIMPTDIQITYYGVGEVGNKEFSDMGEYYLDVVSGNVYVSEDVMVEDVTSPGGDIVGEKTTYSWSLERTLVSVQDELATIQRKMPKTLATNVTLTNGKATIYMNQLVEAGIRCVLSVSGFGQDVLPTFYVSSGAYSDYRIVVYASNYASSASATARIAINYIEY